MRVVSSEEGFNGLAQLILGFEASSIECLALQQAEYDFNLVQPTGRSRREMELDSPFELRQPVVISFVRGVVIEDEVDLCVLRLIGQHAVEEAAKILPLFVLRKSSLHLASADLQTDSACHDAYRCSSARARPCRYPSPHSPRSARLPVCSVFRPRSAPVRSAAGSDKAPPHRRPWEQTLGPCSRTSCAAFGGRCLGLAKRARRRKRWR
jgi:hypothetical protein